MNQPVQFKNLDHQTAQTLLREASIGRQRQQGSISKEQEEGIRMGKQDQSIGWDDAVYALTNAETLGSQVQAGFAKQT